MRVLGLDIATVTGFNILEDGKLINYGKIELNSKHSRIDRYKEFKISITKLIKTYKPNVIALEGVYHGRNAETTAYLNILRGIVFGLTPNKCRILTAPVSSIRKSVLGQGKKHEKEDVFQWAINEFDLIDLKFKTDNDITDSILISYWAFKLDNI